MSIGKGYASKAAFMLIGKGTSASYYPVAVEDPTPLWMGEYDQIPFKSFSAKESSAFLLDDTITGKAGYDAMDEISRMVAGGIELNAWGQGLDAFLLACMGYERVRASGQLEYPTLQGGSSGTVNASTNDTLTKTPNGGWTPDALIGQWVRLSKTSGPYRYDVRRIIDNTGNILTVDKNWSVNPAAGSPFEVGYAWKHTFEMSKHLHIQPVTDFESTPWNMGAYLIRHGILCIDKGVSVWELPGTMIESIRFKLTTDGLMVTVVSIPYCLNFRTIARNADPDDWKFNASQMSAVDGTILTFSKFLFQDATFRIAPFSSGTPLDSDDEAGVSEWELEIKNNLLAGQQTTKTGLRQVEPGRNAKRQVTGRFKVPVHLSNTFLDNYRDGDELMSDMKFSGKDIAGGDASFASNFHLRKAKLKKADAPVRGAQRVEEEYEFQGLMTDTAPAGMPAVSTGAENGELTIETINANPFNFLMGQHQIYVGS